MGKRSILVFGAFGTYFVAALTNASTDGATLEERMDFLENDVAIFQRTKTQDVLSAFDNSSFSREMIREMREVRKEVTGARIDIGKGAATLESLEKSLKENQKKVGLNADGIVILGDRVSKLEIKMPAVERRVGTIEVRNERQVESRRAAYLEVFVLVSFGVLSWIATTLYKKYRATRGGRRRND